MKSIFINRFDAGIAESRNSRGVGQCGVCKHFDITTFPNKLVPYRGLAANTTGQTRIGNIVIGTNGIPYGLGTESGNTHGQLYDKSSIAGDWTSMTNGTVGGTQDQTARMRMLVEFKSYMYFWYNNDNATNQGIAWVDMADSAAIGSQNLTATNLANGVVHPATGYLYIGYDNKIAQITAVGSGYTAAALTLPSNAVVTCIAPFGNYLAIAARIGSALYPRSKVFLWNLSTLDTWTEAIDWPGDLQVINQLGGSLIGVSLLGNTGYTIDRNGITIREYTLGGIPRKIREISTERQTSTDPSAQINPIVNFVFNDKFYFSADIVGGSTSPKYYGLWSLSKSPVSGIWSVAIEQGATSGNTETSVLAAAKLADYAWMTHTANGTVTRTINTSGVNSTTFDCSAFYETVVNPDMAEADYEAKKSLAFVRCNFYLPDATSQVIVKYRVDRATSWTTVFTKTSASPDTDTIGYKTTRPASGEFAPGRYYEFRIESLGGAEITGFSYGYTIIND